MPCPARGDRPVYAYPPVLAPLTDLVRRGQLLESRLDAAADFLGRLNEWQGGGGRKPDDYRRTWSVLLKRDYGSTYQPEVVGPLVEARLVEVDPRYSTATSQSKGYRLGAAFRAAPALERHRLTRPGLRARLERHRVAMEALFPEPVYVASRAWMARLDVDPSYPAWVPALARVFDRQPPRWYCDRYGRVHTVATGTRRDHRWCFLMDGEPLVCSDVKCSQVGILAGTMARLELLLADAELARYGALLWDRGQRYKPVRGRPPVASTLKYLARFADRCRADALRLIDESQHRDIYKRFGGLAGLGRDDAKTGTLSALMDRGKRAADKPLGKVWASEYPDLWAVAMRVNKRERGALARLLQTVESYVCVWRAGGRLTAELPETPLVTIHDGLATTARHAAAVCSVLKEEYATVFGGDYRPAVLVKEL